VDVEALVELDRRHRRLTAEVDDLRAEQKRAGRAVASGSSDRTRAIAEAKQIAVQLEALEGELVDAGDELSQLLRQVPNLVHPDSPPGRGDECNVVVRTVGEGTVFDFQAQDHLTLGESLGIIDVKRAAKVSGSRFAFLLGEAALVEVALIRFALDRLIPLAFVPVFPPVLVREEAMYGTGFFPTDEAQVYKTASDDLYLAGTSEVPLASMHSGETFAEADLPRRYAGISTCFRREAGTYGKDTRGIIRVHQFDKVEMFSFSHPDLSDQEHLHLLSIEEEIFQALEVPYRVVEICAGDLAHPNYRKFDIEAWLPGAGRWLELTSCSNDIDYQARRLAIRYKSKKGNALVHTLNGTAVAVGRTIVALLENHQRPDGSVGIPKQLQPYTGFGVIAR
jgi:seryl-tRNA synthetase